MALSIMLSSKKSLLFLFSSVSILLLLLAPSLVCHAEYLENPSLKWSVQLEGSGRGLSRGLRKGNAIVAYKDGTKIFVTANDGSLHIIQTTNQVNTLAVFVPDEIQDRYTGCRSGATVVDKDIQDGHFVAVVADAAEATTNIDTGEGPTTTVPAPAVPRNITLFSPGVVKEDYIIYVICDSTISSDSIGFNAADNIVSSRVIAVSMDGTLKWSVQVEGKIEGNPVVGKTGVFISHNSNDGIGYLSIIRIDPINGTGNIVATVSPTATRPGSVNGPFGPPALQQRPGWSYDEDEYADDIVIVAENWDKGFSVNQGGLYMLTLSTSGDESLSPTSGYQLQKISSYSYSAIAPPLVYGDSIFLGSAGGTLAGFTGDRRSDLSAILSGRENEINPRWQNEVSPYPLNASQPLWNQPIIDSYGDYLLIPGVDSDFYCFQSDNGRQLWRDEEGSQIMARPHIWDGDPRQPVVYAIESLNGRIRQYDLYSGERNWDYSCADISDKLCLDAVEAEFAITPSGNTIYYGDIYGRINSLEVAKFATEAPTVAPSSMPSATPTSNPTLTSVPSGSSVVAVTTLSPTTMPVTVEIPQTITATSSPISAAVKPNEGLDEVEDNQWEDNTSNNDGVSAIIDEQAAAANQKDESSNVSMYIGGAIAGLCALMIPIVIFSLLRERKKRRKPRSKMINEMVVEIIDECDSDDLDDLESQNFDSIRSDDSGSSGGGIEVEFRHPKAFTPALVTPTKKKKKKRKKRRSLPDTPNTVQTLESIEELPEESLATSGNSAMVVMGDDDIEAVNLRERFDNIADNQERKTENGSVARGEAGMVTGSNHLELAIGKKNSLSPLYSGEKDSDNNNGYPSDDDEIPPPPPPPLSAHAVSNSSTQWTWNSLLKIGTSQSSKKMNNNLSTPVKTTSEKLQLKESPRTIDHPVSSTQEEKPISTTVEKKVTSSSSTKNQTEDDALSVVPVVPPHPRDTARVTTKKTKMKSNPRSVESEIHEPSQDVSQKHTSSIHRAETPPLKDQKIDFNAFTEDELIGQTSPEHGMVYDTDQEEPSKMSKEIPEKETRDNIRPSDPILEEKERIPGSTKKSADEEKKEGGEECYSRPQTPIQPPEAPVLPFTMLSDAADAVQSTFFGSPHHSPTPSNSSNSSNDDSLYTSMTGMSGKSRKKEDPKDLSPFSTYTLDNYVHRRDRSEIAGDNDDKIKGILTQPDLSKSNAGSTNKFQYPDEEDVPDDEKSVAPGIQYMSKLTEEEKAQKYGKSVRSKRDSNIGFRSSPSASRNESGVAPLAQMYEQLASMGQQKKEEKKHSFKRRNKRAGKEDSSEQQDQQSGEGGGDTWGSFLNELAEAEKHFYAPSPDNKNQSLLNSNSDSEEDDDAEIARINNFS